MAHMLFIGFSNVAAFSNGRRYMLDIMGLETYDTPYNTSLLLLLLFIINASFDCRHWCIRVTCLCKRERERGEGVLKTFVSYYD